MIEGKEVAEVETLSWSCGSCDTGAIVVLDKAADVILEGRRRQSVVSLEGMFIASLAVKDMRG